MMMPEVDGLEFLSRLSALPSPPPVVANSGFDGFRAEALRRGALAFLMKPVSAEALLGALRSAIERRQVDPSLLAGNAAGVEQARRLALERSGRAVARLDEAGYVGFCGRVCGGSCAGCRPISASACASSTSCGETTCASKPSTTDRFDSTRVRDTRERTSTATTSWQPAPRSCSPTWRIIPATTSPGTRRSSAAGGFTSVCR